MPEEIGKMRATPTEPVRADVLADWLCRSLETMTSKRNARRPTTSIEKFKANVRKAVAKFKKGPPRGNISKLCRECSMSRQTITRWMEDGIKSETDQFSAFCKRLRIVPESMWTDEIEYIERSVAQSTGNSVAIHSRLEEYMSLSPTESELARLDGFLEAAISAARAKPAKA